MKAQFMAVIFLLCVMQAVADETAELSELHESTTAALISATNDSDGDVRFVAFRALKDQPRSEAIVQAFRRGLDDEKANVRQLALVKMVDIEGPTEEILARLIAAVSQPELAATASQLLTQIGEPAVPCLLEALKSGSPTEKSAVIGILGQLQLGAHGKEAVAAVVALLQDQDRDVRIGAVVALRNMADFQFGRVNTKLLRFAAGVIAQHDANKDGSLTEDEWSKMPQDVSSADQDKDSRLSVRELALYYSQQPPTNN